MTPAASVQAEDKSPLWLEIAGWAGMAAILGAFAATSYQLGIDKRWLAILNAAGASGVAALCWHRRAWSAMFLEIAWAAVALTSLAGLPPQWGLPLALVLAAGIGIGAQRGRR